MADPKGFLKVGRLDHAARPIEERVKDWRELYLPVKQAELTKQASRCMNCGVPFCSNGCPLGNLVPDWNDLVYKDRWHEAYLRLDRTNPFPEFTGKLCPAPCEDACVLTINDAAVTIKSVEISIIERAFKEGWVKPGTPAAVTGKRVAIVGSGPAGLAAAVQLRRAGHETVVFERSDRVGGLIRYGVPDYKMAKEMVDRRVALLEEEGIEFRTGIAVGDSLPLSDLQRDFDAVALCVGAGKPRDLAIPGRELAGIHLAMEFLTAQNKACKGEPLPAELHAQGKRVVILGGGDTGADCFGVAIRQGAASVTQFDHLPAPDRFSHNVTWPESRRTKHSAVYDEGGQRAWSTRTVSFEGEAGVVRVLRTYKVRLAGGMSIPVPSSEELVEADLVLIAIGFLGPDFSASGLSKLYSEGRYETNLRGVFAAGDARRGPSLIVHAIAEGRNVAHEIDRYLMGRTSLAKSFRG